MITEPLAEEEKELYDSFTELGSDPEMSDVEFAFQAQAEVALREPAHNSVFKEGEKL